jgi:hypothetical protein
VLRRLLLLPCVFAGACAASPDDPGDDVPGVPEPPFAVSAYFAPSGFMGDGSDGVSLVADTEGCTTRPDGARGDCYRFTYTPSTQLWAGVYWQFPPNNWGSMEGKAIAPGASSVSFYAATDSGGETLKVTIGGIRDVTLPYSDTLKAEGTFTLTTSMTRYTVDLGGDYDKVIGGFSWTTSYPEGTDPTSADPIVLYLDDVVWE